jgi:hypothetical protein
MSTIDNATSLTTSSPVTGSTGCAAGRVVGPSDDDDPGAVDPGVADAGDVPGLVGVVVAGDGVDVAPARGAAGDDDDDGVRGVAPARELCESPWVEMRMATLSSATVRVTSRLKRISSTRNALVCTVSLDHRTRAGQRFSAAGRAGTW